MRFVGDSFGDASRLWAVEQARRERVAADALAQMYARDQMDQRNRMAQSQFEQDLALRQKLGEESRLDRARDYRLREQEWYDWNADQVERNQMTREYYDWLKKQPSSTSAAGTPSQRYANFAGLADNGQLDPSMLKGLPEQDAAMLTRRNEMAKAELRREYGIAAGLADALNQQGDLSRRITGEKAEMSPTRYWAPWTWMHTDKDAQLHQSITDSEGQLKNVQERVAPYADPKLRNRYVTFDTRSGRYVPNLPNPDAGQAPAAPGRAGGGGRVVQFLSPEDAAAFEAGGGTGTSTGSAPSRPAAQPAAGTSTGAYKPQRSTWFYDRVNELISSGLDPVQAKLRADKEEQSLFAQ